MRSLIPVNVSQISANSSTQGALLPGSYGLWHWGATRKPDRDKAIRLIYRLCGKATFPIVACDKIGDPNRARHVEFAKGLGAGTNQTLKSGDVGARKPILKISRQRSPDDPRRPLVRDTRRLHSPRDPKLRSIAGAHVQTATPALGAAQRTGWRWNFGEDAVQEHPPHHEYRLTKMGRDFYPIILMLMACAECGEPFDHRKVYFAFTGSNESAVWFGDDWLRTETTKSRYIFDVAAFFLGCGGRIWPMPNFRELAAVSVL